VFSVRVPKGATPAAEPAGAREVARLPSSLVELTVLCVDNEPEILAGMSALLTRWGVRVITAAGATEARLAMLREHPAVVLADYRLAESECDGIDLLVELCGDDASAAPAGVLITADHTAAVAARSRDLGFPVLRKPLKPAALRALLGALSSNRTLPAT
jgi:CheY-like chemotaxis protein